jgi:DNA-directed RNA polymerase subunit K/omega
MVQTDTYEGIMATYDPAKNTTKPIMTLYEKTTLIGTRMHQLANNAPTTLSEDELGDISNIRDIAEKELRLKKIPLMISRPIQSGMEYWRVEDLTVF